jgi:diguanylate cyclase (GGDEF)-like protein/PAS domain S-box-containing protein
MRGGTYTQRHPRPASSDAFRSAYVAAGVAMARLTPAAVIIDANPRFAALVRRSAEELPGVELLDLLHPDDAAAMRAGRLSSFAAGAIHSELRLVAGAEVVHCRATISIAREPGDLPDSLVLTIEDLTESRRREAEQERRRLLDPETGLPNADLLSRRLAEAIRAVRTGGRPPALLMVEFDRAAALGDEPGPAVTAELLDQVTRRLAEQLRPRDYVARTGANEFGVILTEVETESLAEEVGRRLQAGLETHFRLGGRDVRVPVTMGVANYPVHGRTADVLIRRARREMYGGAAATVTGDDLGAVTDELEQRVALLEPVSLFQSVSDQVLRRIARYLSAQTAAAGEELSRPGGPPALRIIGEGLCEVRTPERLPLLTLGPGDFMGAESLLLERPAAVHMHALTEVRMLVLEPEMLDRLAPPGTAFRDALRVAAGQRDHHLRALIERPANHRPGTSALNLAVYSAKGGSGRTTLALNIAAELGRRHPGEVLLVDLSLPYNHVALLANLSPSTCLARVARSEPQAFGPLAWSAVLPHPAGFMVLPATLRPEEAELVTPELVARTLAVLSPSFRYVVFDLGVNLDDRVLAALELSDEVILMATPELASMHDTRQVLDLVSRVLQVPAGRIHTVLNHRSPDSALTRKVVEDVLGRPLAAEFRYQGLAPEMAGLEGRLQLKSGRGSEFSRGVRQLLDGLPGVRAARTA